jgi:hypothetical protein
MSGLLLADGLEQMAVRANPRSRLLAFEEMGDVDQSALGPLRSDPTLYGALLDHRGGVKVVDSASARLFTVLSRRPAAASDLGVDAVEVARLILDGVLEVDAPNGGFVSGSQAVDTILGSSWLPPPPASTTARLSMAALKYGQKIDLDDAVSLSARLYFYGRLPMSPTWSRRFPSPDEVARFVGSERVAPRLGRSWRLIAPSPANDGWTIWSSRATTPDSGRVGQHKLYVSPLPADVPTAFAATVEVAGAEDALALKVGKDGASLLRPDKIVIYFGSFDRLRRAASRLARLLSGCRGHGVPFTAEFGECDGLLSWGMDPPASEQLPDWRERESWRLWLTNRLAVALTSARRDGGVFEPWCYAIARIALEGIEPATWTPTADPWGADR